MWRNGSSGSAPVPEPNAVAGTGSTVPPLKVGTGTAGDTGTGTRTQRPSFGSPAVQPRIFDVKLAAAYLGVSAWSVKDWVYAGLIPTVEFPAYRPREGERPRTKLRRIFIDREDLDRFIESRKSGGTAVLQSAARPVEADSSQGKRRAVPTLCPQHEVA